MSLQAHSQIFICDEMENENTKLKVTLQDKNDENIDPQYTDLKNGIIFLSLLSMTYYLKNRYSNLKKERI